MGIVRRRRLRFGGASNARGAARENSKLGLAEALLKLHLVARHRSNPQKPPYVSVLHYALMAEDSV